MIGRYGMFSVLHASPFRFDTSDGRYSQSFVRCVAESSYKLQAALSVWYSFNVSAEGMPWLTALPACIRQLYGEDTGKRTSNKPSIEFKQLFFFVTLQSVTVMIFDA